MGRSAGRQALAAGIFSSCILSLTKASSQPVDPSSQTGTSARPAQPIRPGVDGGAGAGGSGQTDDLPVHTTVIGLAPMPIFPPGARVWFADAQGGYEYPYNVPGAMSVRDKKNGRLLFGKIYDDSTGPASPIRIGSVTPYCSQTFAHYRCVTWLADIEFGTSPTVHTTSGTSRTLALGDRRYEVFHMAWNGLPTSNTAASPLAVWISPAK